MGYLAMQNVAASLFSLLAIALACLCRHYSKRAHKAMPGWASLQKTGSRIVTRTSRLALGTLACRAEEMDDTEALARALRENLHGLALTTDERMQAILSARKMPPAITRSGGARLGMASGKAARGLTTYEILLYTDNKSKTRGEAGNGTPQRH